jgi:hypothetical protein
MHRVFSPSSSTNCNKKTQLLDYQVVAFFLFFILHSSLNFAKQNFWASRFAHFVRSRRAIRSITFATSWLGGSASIPLASWRIAKVAYYAFLNN